MHGKSIAQIKKKSSKTNLACFEKIGYGIEKHTANENMGEKKMADGFLAPTGEILSQNRKFSCADRAGDLRSDGQTDEPIQELYAAVIFYLGVPQTRRTGKSPCRYGLRPRRTEGIRRPKGQKAWIARTYGRAVEKATV